MSSPFKTVMGFPTCYLYKVLLSLTLIATKVCFSDDKDCTGDENVLLGVNIQGNVIQVFHV